LATAVERTEELGIAVGEQVKSGQRVRVRADAEDFALAGKSGQIKEIAPVLGMMQKRMTSVVVTVDPEESQVPDDSFKEESRAPSLENAARFLRGLPGRPDFSPFLDSGRRIQAIVVLGMDQDLLSVTNPYFVKTGIESVKTGIDMLRKITGIHNVILAVPQHLVQVAGAAGAGVRTVDDEYPASHPRLMARHILSAEMPEGGASVEAEVAFFNAEAVSAIGAAYNTGELPLEKLVTCISKDGSRRLVKAPIGTPLQDILEAFGESVAEGDRIILGGPMTGQAVYTTAHPIQADTDTVLVQDVSQIAETPDIACINCGECVRICPVNIPVNILVRFLEAEQYEAAASQAELDSCIECGLCAFVCESRIPIFQHIKLAKHTLERMRAEESNA
jgi:electron transport complex protein RnfC